MADETESLTIRLLQEMRESIRRIEDRMDGYDERMADLVQRIDGNTLVFNLVAGVVHQHDERIGELEQRDV